MALKILATLVLLLVLLPAAGCQRAESATASITAAPPAAPNRLVGNWTGVFAIAADAPQESFDSTTVAVCKSMRVDIQFREDGTMNMAATMTLPGAGEQSNESQGRWTLIKDSGDSVQLQSTEDGGKTEELALQFRGEDVFEMVPPNELQKLGVLRFTRQP
jgi:hypothetical protein